MKCQNCKYRQAQRVRFVIDYEKMSFEIRRFVCDYAFECIDRKDLTDIQRKSYDKCLRLIEQGRFKDIHGKKRQYVDVIRSISCGEIKDASWVDERSCPYGVQFLIRQLNKEVI